MLTLVETRIESSFTASARWSCTTKGVVYFRVHRGLHPDDRELMAQTYNCSIGGIDMRTPSHSGTVHMFIEACGADKQVIDSLEFRIMPEDVHNYYKYRKWFEDNFMKAARKSAAGVKIALLQKRFTGVPCSRCVTSISGEPEDPRCPECYGTGFTGGFYSPIVVYGLRGPAVEHAADKGTAPVKRIIQSFILPPYPVLQAGDYIVDLSDYSMYEVGGTSRQLMEMDHQRLGSTSYDTDRLNRDHPLSVYKIEKDLPEVTGVSKGEGTVTVRGRGLQPRYGILRINVRNSEHDNPVTSDEELYSFEHLNSVSDTELVFDIDSRFNEVKCDYQAVVNGLFFEGDIDEI